MLNILFTGTKMTKQLRIGFDIDGVLRNLVKTVLNKVNKQYKTNFKEKEVTMWDFDSELIAKAIPHFNLYDFIDDNPEILTCAKQYNTGRELFSSVYQFACINRHKIILVSDQPIRWRRKTIQWLLNHSYCEHSIIFTTEKHTWNLDVIFDDKIETCIECAGNRILTFLFPQPWNRNFCKSQIGDSTTFEYFQILGDLNYIEMLELIKNFKYWK